MCGAATCPTTHSRHRSYYWPAMSFASCKGLDEASVFGCSSVSSVESIEYWAGSARPYVIPPPPPLLLRRVSLFCLRVEMFSCLVPVPLFCFDLFTHIYLLPSLTQCIEASHLCTPTIPTKDYCWQTFALKAPMLPLVVSSSFLYCVNHNIHVCWLVCCIV